MGPLFSWQKINQYFWYHPEIFLGVFYDNTCELGWAAGAINANYLTVDLDLYPWAQGAVPMGQRWLRISLKYSSGRQGLMVFDST